MLLVVKLYTVFMFQSSTIVGITAVSQHKVDKKQNGTLATVVPNKSSEKLQVYRQVEILLKSVADGDMELVSMERN